MPFPFGVSRFPSFQSVPNQSLCVCLFVHLFSACRLSLLFPAFCCTVSISSSTSSTFSCFFPLLLRQAAAFSPAGNGATVIALDSTQTDRLQSVHSRDGDKLVRLVTLANAAVLHFVDGVHRLNEYVGAIVDGVHHHHQCKHVLSRYTHRVCWDYLGEKEKAKSSSNDRR